MWWPFRRKQKPTEDFTYKLLWTGAPEDEPSDCVEIPAAKDAVTIVAFTMQPEFTLYALRIKDAKQIERLPGVLSRWADALLKQAKGEQQATDGDSMFESFEEYTRGKDA